MIAMFIEVESYSEYRADERPFRFAMSGRTYEVIEVEDRWYSPRAMYFRVVASDGSRYVLYHDEEADLWTLEAFRARAIAGQKVQEGEAPRPVR
jgi:hypothetical protein